jgi:hypothetical protein
MADPEVKYRAICSATTLFVIVLCPEAEKGIQIGLGEGPDRVRDKISARIRMI